MINSNTVSNTQPQTEAGFDLFRLSQSKEVVDVCSNTLRQYAREGLRLYRVGRAVFVSKSELEAFIKSHAN